MGNVASTHSLRHQKSIESVLASGGTRKLSLYEALDMEDRFKNLKNAMSLIRRDEPFMQYDDTLSSMATSPFTRLQIIGGVTGDNRIILFQIKDDNNMYIYRQHSSSIGGQTMFALRHWMNVDGRCTCCYRLLSGNG